MGFWGNLYMLHLKMIAWYLQLLDETKGPNIVEMNVVYLGYCELGLPGATFEGALLEMLLLEFVFLKQ